jgi:hypothetical protein
MSPGAHDQSQERATGTPTGRGRPHQRDGLGHSLVSQSALPTEEVAYASPASLEQEAEPRAAARLLAYIIAEVSVSDPLDGAKTMENT